MERTERPSRAQARAAPTTPPRGADPDREARRLNRQAADALKKLGLRVDEEPAFVFRP
jgi:hypothetical protein